VVTQEMMERYGELSVISDAASREAALDAWLEAYGHRGPLESDPARPRFIELREVLLRDLAASSVGAGAAPRAGRGSRSAFAWLLRPFYWIDARREWFRDELMKRWQRLRGRILVEAAAMARAGELDAPEDVFFTCGSAPPSAEGAAGMSLRDAARAGRERVERARGATLPLTASRQEIRQALAQADRAEAETAGRRVFPGIPLGPAVVEGRARKADDLMVLLEEAGGPEGLGPDDILVVAALEPSWAVVFPRVKGVVAEIGGELSHASILLREARRPAVVNCEGIFRQVRTGDRLRIDGERGLVELLVDPAQDRTTGRGVR
jgi:pyruvate,water dikinase